MPPRMVSTYTILLAFALFVNFLPKSRKISLIQLMSPVYIPSYFQHTSEDLLFGERADAPDILQIQIGVGLPQKPFHRGRHLVHHHFLKTALRTSSLILSKHA